MPRKPSQTFGHISFGKDGRVKQRLTRLSDEKVQQELQAVEKFLELLARRCPTRSIHLIQQLPERDQDFLVEIDGQETEIQLTELVDRSFTFPMSQTEYASGAWTHAIQKQNGEIPWRIDLPRKDDALADLIRRKVSKCYAKNPARPLWLVVFSTFLYETEYFEDGQRQQSAGLQVARDYIRSEARQPFDAIWFCYLELLPVSVWPP